MCKAYSTVVFHFEHHLICLRAAIWQYYNMMLYTTMACIFIDSRPFYRASINGSNLFRGVSIFWGKDLVRWKEKLCRYNVDGQNGNRLPILTCDKVAGGKWAEHDVDRHATTDRTNSGECYLLRAVEKIPKK